MSAYALKARYLFPIDGPPIPDGVLTLAGDRIVAAGENVSGNVPRDLGNVALLPGLINAHAHLEFSDLPSPLGGPACRLRTGWAGRRSCAGSNWPKPIRSSVGIGLPSEGWTRWLWTGTAAVGEIASPGWPEAGVSVQSGGHDAVLQLAGAGARTR